MKMKTAIIAVLAMLLACGMAYGQTGNYAVASLTVYCWNGTINLTTDKSVYAVNDVAAMSVNLTDYMDVNLNEYVIIDLYNSTGKVRNMAIGNAAVPANGTNTTIYYNDFGTLESGTYTIRAELINKTYYPGLNKTLFSCSIGTPLISEKNVTVLTERPNPPTNVKIFLTNNTSGEVMLNWTLSNSSNITNYIIYAITNYSAGFNFNSPYATVSNTSTNYTDASSVNYDQIYYIVRANGTNGLTDLNTKAVAKFNIKLYTGWNMMSVPILLYDYTLDNAVYNAENTDELWRYDASNQGDPYDKTDYYTGFGWFGDFSSFDNDKGYWYNSKKANHTVTPYNLTFTGDVPVADRNQTFYNGYNLIGITSVATKNVDSVFTSEVNTDELWKYDSSNQGDPYDKTDYYGGFGWFGDFGITQPGLGYWYNSKNATTYTWTYTP